MSVLPLMLQVFRYGTKDGKPADRLIKKHTYILEPVTGSAKYEKLKASEFTDSAVALQKAGVNLDDVTFCLSKVLSSFICLCCDLG